ncbi:hypothetical protein FGADI_6281 [Fusarium gaditjirri]|uniref:Uncharacterized protein n=1 Tax=Fusarium gaditjirri TaxID=282569 RepID=A0A8H4WX83_9HYPO|nr:hypothetical protein FGADI_6281 [Fusarium gaditjirri]
MSTPSGVHDLMIVFDAMTGGRVGVTALKEAIPDIINFVALAGCFERIGVLAYQNYTSENPIQWSGWCSPSSTTGTPSQDDILNFVKALETPDSSEYGSNPASKGALARAYLEMREGQNATMLLLYTHAPPMFEHTSGRSGTSSKHYKFEQLQLLLEYETIGPFFRDWVTGAHILTGNVFSTKRAVVLSFGFDFNFNNWSPYLYLSTLTGGGFYLTTCSGRVISRLTIGLLLVWMRADGNIDTPKSSQVAFKQDLTSYVVAEADILRSCGRDTKNLKKANVHAGPRSCLRVRYDRVITDNGQFSVYTSRNLARKYIDGDEDYKKAIVDRLDRIISTDVSVIAIHPIYGQLWRAVCSDQTGNNNIKRSLLERFRAKVSQIPDARDKNQARTWLEESYTFFHELNEEMSVLPAHHQFPLVYVDPDTVDLQGNQYDAALTRAQLLNLWKSCDTDILGRLGNVLIRMHYVQQEKDMPANMTNSWPCLTPRIPLALIMPEYGGKF